MKDRVGECNLATVNIVDSVNVNKLDSKLDLNFIVSSSYVVCVSNGLAS